MTIAIADSFSDRLIREPDLGQLRDGNIRYLTMRADALMGMFACLGPAARAEALEALSRSVAEHGGRSVGAYVESGAGSSAALMKTMAATAADLGWGKWTFDVADDGRSIAVTVRNSPFAQFASIADRPVCAPIEGILTALAPHLLGAAARTRETACSALEGQGCCRFVIAT